MPAEVQHAGSDMSVEERRLAMEDFARGEDVGTTENANGTAENAVRGANIRGSVRVRTPARDRQGRRSIGQQGRLALSAG